jgi:hypothetical protein
MLKIHASLMMEEFYSICKIGGSNGRRGLGDLLSQLLWRKMQLRRGNAWGCISVI